jgi:DNA-3-methyladenine glycosylase II
MLRKAVHHLKRADPVLARVIAEVGPCRFATHDSMPYFTYLTRAIVYQQLSGKAAATIFGRFEAACGGTISAPAVAALPESRLRAAGLSTRKARYVQDLARRVLDGSLVLEGLERHGDEDIIAALTQVKGIGRWSVQMFLMFRLGRPDVLPGLDLGIQKAVRRAYRLRKHPSPARVLEIGRRWSPYATIASWYLWRSLDGPAD